jgi:hypothetical protein
MKKLVSLVAALAMVATFAMSAAAADWNFYGSARIETYYESVDQTGVSDSENFNLLLAGNSRIGANVKVSDELTGRFEYSSAPGLRLLYANWNFGAGSLLVGQDYTPVGMFFSNSMKDGNTGLIGYGTIYGGREPQLKLRFGDFQLAAIENPTAAVAGFTNENTLPRLEASYFIDFGPVRLRAQAGYTNTEVDNGAVSADLDGYIFGVGASYTGGPFYAHATAGMGENLSVAGISNGTNSMPTVNAATGAVLDAETTMYMLIAGFQVNEMFKIEIGYGKEETELGAAEQDTNSYYIVAPITLAPQVTIFPEVGVFDTEDVNNQETTYAGLTWKIDF